MIAKEKKNQPGSGSLVVPEVERTAGLVKSLFGGEEQQCFQGPDGKTWYSVMQVCGPDSASTLTKAIANRASHSRAA